MSGASTPDPSFIQLYGYIVWPILGVLGGFILLIGGYAIWRGPHRSFFPVCLTNKLRKNIMDDEADFNEKRIHPLGRVPSPVRPPPRVHRERRERKSRADAFKQEVMAAQGRDMQWDNNSVVGMKRDMIEVGGGSPMSETGTLVGSAWGKEASLSSETLYGAAYTPTRPQRPPSAQIMDQQQLAMGSPSSQTSSAFDDSPTNPAVITRPKRVSSMQTQQARVQTRYTQQYQGYDHRMKEEDDSHVW